MSEFPLPATVPERRDTGRHGRPSSHGKSRQNDARGLHLYISLGPATLMALLGLVAIADLLSVGTSSAMGRLLLVVIAAGAVVVLGATIFAADIVTRRERRAFPRPERITSSGTDDVQQRRLGELAFLVSRGRQELQSLRDQIAAGDIPPPRSTDSRPVPADDAFSLLTGELHKAQIEAWNAVIGVASAQSGNSAQRVEVFVNLARRMQSLSHRAIQGLDELENQVEDPDLLKGLFRVDHLSTRMRRQAESLAVIGGAAPRRQWSRPVTVYEVLRSAIAEVEHYNRVKVAPPVEGTLDGSAVADVIHLLAELVENATKFAPPHTQVILRAESVTAGLAIEIEDRGLGIPRDTQRRLNDLLADTGQIEFDGLLQDGRIGLLVVAALSRRHNIAIRLQTNLYGGTQAIVVIPKELIGSEQQDTGPMAEARPEPAEPAAALPPRTPNSVSPSIPSSGSGQSIPKAPARGDQDVTGASPGEPSAAVSWTDQSTTSTHPEARTSVPETPASARMRPELPKRRAQTNLAPELLNTAPPSDDEADPIHTPGLMAAFQKGMRTGQEEDSTDGTGGTG